VPDEVTSVGRLLQLPPIPDVPEPLRGKSLAVVEAAFMGSKEDGRALLAPLRELGPAIDTFSVLPAAGLSRLHQDPEHPVPGEGDGMLIRELTPEAVDAFVAAAGPGSGSPLLSVELRHLGGELARARASHGALASIDADFALYAIGIAAGPEAAVVAAAIDRIRDALAPWDSGKSYMNFRDRSVDPADFYSEVAYRRLQKVRSQYDPTGVFQANHPVSP
jgi:FAD/FMN-containing dehydrogenase